MLGRKDYTREELDHARDTIERQLAAYRELAEAVRTGSDPRAQAALEAFEPLFANHMTMVLDRYFVHRLRVVTGKDGNPLNEVELLAASLLDDGAAFRTNKVIKLTPGETVLGLEEGDRIALGADEFERLAHAFLADLEAKFVGVAA